MLNIYCCSNKEPGDYLCTPTLIVRLSLRTKSIFDVIKTAVSDNKYESATDPKPHTECIFGAQRNRTN